MRLKMFGLTIFALLALGMTAAVAALAAHKWLNLAGQPLTTLTEPALTDGAWLWHHKPPAILGGGSILISCDGQFHGTVGPNDGSTGLETQKDNGLDLISDILTLTGQLNAISCEVLESTNAICPRGEKVTVAPIDLPWSSELLLFENVVYDHLKQDVTEPKGQPAFETTCKSIKTSCSGLDRSKWLGNDTDGALFEFRGELTNNCSDGGTSTLLGGFLVLDFFVS